ncbi:MAG: YebC/PmpR family DNA-binding transcriptional regulator [Acidobacteria bacterium]|nr:YebC/PmpR family DNA-binding transcriptional regulator [Acidobacteriota bacterium]MDA1233171.1 YebC/PmpR family DNA-binding transcriptional regulator [Acidobacteriota bacterium]
MSGHSKWATIKHKKAATDAKRGKVFTRLIREIQIAARHGGGDPEANPRLRTAITSAKSQSMPQDNIKRAILRGAGGLEGESLEEITFEGYGPAGVAVFVETVTDNRNRTVSEVRHMFSKNGGNLGENGCVAYMFDRKSLITVPKSALGEDELMEAALGAGSEDMQDEDENWVVVSDYTAHDQVLTALQGLGIEPASAELARVPQVTVKLEGKQAASVLRMIDAIEEQDDVQNVFANFDIDDEELEKLSA